MSRDAVLDGLLRRRIGTGVHYRGVHLHPYYASSYGIEPGMLPVATRHLRPDPQPPAQPEHDRRRPGRRRRGAEARARDGPALVS